MSNSSTNNDEPQPAWSPFARRQDLDRFWEMVSAEVSRYGPVDADIDVGQLIVGTTPNVAHCGVANIAQTCAGLDRRDWSAAIAHHFHGLMDDAHAQQVEALIADEERARNHLRIRLVPTPIVQSIDAAHLELPLGVSLALAIDVRGHCAYVGNERIEQWDPTPEELMLTAAEHVRKRVRVRRRSRVRFGGRHVHLHGSSLFLTGHLFDLGTHVPDLGHMGALVSAPTARELLVVPVNDSDQLVQNVTGMLATTVETFCEGPNSVAPVTWWWRAGHDLEPAFTMDKGPKPTAPEPLASYLAAAFSRAR